MRVTWGRGHRGLTGLELNRNCYAVFNCFFWLEQSRSRAAQRHQAVVVGGRDKAVEGMNHKSAELLSYE